MCITLNAPSIRREYKWGRLTERRAVELLMELGMEFHEATDYVGLAYSE